MVAEAGKELPKRIGNDRDAASVTKTLLPSHIQSTGPMEVPTADQTRFRGACCPRTLS